MDKKLAAPNVKLPVTAAPLPSSPVPTPQPKKKPVILIGLVIVLIIFGVGIFLLVKSVLTPKSTTPPKALEAVNTVPVENRPYVTLSPTSQGKHPQGTEVEITVHNTTLASTKAEYELEYQAGTLLQGAFGSLDFTKEAPPVSKVLLLGTCSAGGKCDYNKDVTGGTLLVRLSGGEQKFAVKGEWSYQLMSEREGKFASRDSKFRVDVGTKGLPAGSWVVLIQTMGLPQAVPDKSPVVAGPYFVSAGTDQIKSAELEWRLSEDNAAVKLLGWTGSSWKEYKSAFKDKTLTATIDKLGTFVVVSSAAK